MALLSDIMNATGRMKETERVSYNAASLSLYLYDGDPSTLLLSVDHRDQQLQDIIQTDGWEIPSDLLSIFIQFV